VYRLLRGHYSPFLALTDSCVNPVWLFSTSAFWPRSRSLCRLLPAPAATGIIPTLSLRIFPRMLGPMPRRSHRLLMPVTSSVSSAFPWAAEDWLPASTRETTFSRKSFSRLQTFLYVQASEFARLPGCSYRCAYGHRAAEAFRSGQNVLRCLGFISALLVRSSYGRAFTSGPPFPSPNRNGRAPTTSCSVAGARSTMRRCGR